MSALWPSRTRAFTAPTWMTRAKTWASGRNSRVEARVITVRGEQLVELVDRHGQLGHEVAVGQHAALGTAGGAGGVDDRGEVQRGGRRTPCLELVVGDVGAEPRQDVDRVVLDRPDVPQLLEVRADLGHPAQVRETLGDHGTRAGVAEDVADLRRRRRLVDRDAHRPGEPDGVVDQRPFVAGPRDQRDPVSGGDTGGDESLGHPADLVQELRGGDVGPLLGTGQASPEDDRVGRLRGVVDHVVGEVPGRGHGDGHGGGELAHALSCGPGCRASIGGEATVRRQHADC